MGNLTLKFALTLAAALILLPSSDGMTYDGQTEGGSRSLTPWVRSACGPDDYVPCGCQAKLGGMNENSGICYNIWTDNCHNAANFCVAHPPRDSLKTGIISCRGNLAIREQGGHTFNWSISQKNESTYEACTYNWGKSCCWLLDSRKTEDPPNISSGSAQACVQKGCGNQYDFSLTRALRSRELVQIPDQWACVRKVQGIPANDPVVLSLAQRGKAGDLNACLVCCQDYASAWMSPQWGKAKQNGFRQNCRYLCDIHFATVSNLSCGGETPAAQLRAQFPKPTELKKVLDKIHE